MAVPSGLRIDVQVSPAAAEFCLWGDLDADGAGPFVAEAMCLVLQGRRHLVVDCAAVTFCDTFGLGALSLLLDLVHPDGSVIVARPSRPVARMLEIARLAGRCQIPVNTIEPSDQDGPVEASGGALPWRRLWNRSSIEAQKASEQLTVALQDRAVVEQAKGVVAERTGLSMEQTLTLLRDHADHHRVRLVDLARGIVDGSVGSATLDTLY